MSRGQALFNAMGRLRTYRMAYHNADDEGPILTADLFKQVAKTTNEFDKYINIVHGEKERRKESL